MAALSNSLISSLLNATLRNTAYSSPATVYVALFTVAPTAAGGGTEVSGGAYARQAVAFGPPAGDQVANSVDITFPVATAGWGTVVACAIFDAAAAGTMLYFGALSASVAIGISDQAKFSAGQLAVALA